MRMLADLVLFVAFLAALLVGARSFPETVLGWLVAIAIPLAFAVAVRVLLLRNYRNFGEKKVFLVTAIAAIFTLLAYEILITVPLPLPARLTIGGFLIVVAVILAYRFCPR